VVLPPLALGLEAHGWRDLIASRLGRIRHPVARLLSAYAIWLATSALLTLDVAVVAAASVGVAVAGRDSVERRWQLGGAILGANVGSLLFPFSNLTNLVLVSASGVGLATYVGVAAGPQLAAAVVVGLLLAARSRSALDRARRAGKDSAPEPMSDPAGASGAASWSVAVVLGAVAGAIACGLLAIDVAYPFAAASAALVGAAVVRGRLSGAMVVGSLPVWGLVVVTVAAVFAGPLATAGAAVPGPGAGVGALLLAVGAGGLLASLANNLPAAAVGAGWLAGAGPGTIVAFLIGTNIAAIVTPYGSVATLLARRIGSSRGVELTSRGYMGGAWRYAGAGTLAAVAVLIAIGR
jgi:arsenical pump membrane protein